MKILVLFLGFVLLNAQQYDHDNILNLCNKNISLTNTSISLTLSQSMIYSSDNPCIININVPKTYLIFIRTIDNETEQAIIENKDVYTNISSNNNDTCPINIFQNNDIKSVLYSVDPCQEKILSRGGLVGNQIQLHYVPGKKPSKKWLSVTAIGTGEMCFNSKQHTCLQAGWAPILCISKELVCNGVINCPTDGIFNDENEQICKDKNIINSNNWEKIAKEFLHKFTGKNKGFLPAIQKGGPFQATTVSTYIDHNIPKLNSTNNSAAISEYGPWGYLMLGMLICGTVLTFCGLWECCCRRNKAPRQTNTGTVTPSGVSVTSGAVASTAVLVVTSGPPQYEELDQPPSYSVLFPEKDVQNT